MTLSRDNAIFPPVPPVNSLVHVSEPLRAFWAETAPFEGPRLPSYVASGATENQGHRQACRARRGRIQDTFQSNYCKPWKPWAFIEIAALCSYQKMVTPLTPLIWTQLVYCRSWQAALVRHVEPVLCSEPEEKAADVFLCCCQCVDSQQVQRVPALPPSPPLHLKWGCVQRPRLSRQPTCFDTGAVQVTYLTDIQIKVRNWLLW